MGGWGLRCGHAGARTLLLLRAGPCPCTSTPLPGSPAWRPAARAWRACATAASRPARRTTATWPSCCWTRSSLPTSSCSTRQAARAGGPGGGHLLTAGKRHLSPYQVCSPWHMVLAVKRATTDQWLLATDCILSPPRPPPPPSAGGPGVPGRAAAPAGPAAHAQPRRRHPAHQTVAGESGAMPCASCMPGSGCLAAGLGQQRRLELATLLACKEKPPVQADGSEARPATALLTARPVHACRAGAVEPRHQHWALLL